MIPQEINIIEMFSNAGLMVRFVLLMLIFFGVAEAYAVNAGTGLFKDLAVDSPDVELIYPISGSEGHGKRQRTSRFS